MSFTTEYFACFSLHFMTLVACQKNCISDMKSTLLDGQMQMHLHLIYNYLYIYIYIYIYIRDGVIVLMYLYSYLSTSTF